ncbi:FAD/NAD(P)-binding protein [Streptomyces sp. NPDC002536]
MIGTGPRGLSVLERLAVRLAGQHSGKAVELYAVDAVEVGCGRIWRTDQPDWLLMNTPAGEVTMFSGPADDGPARPGAGPSLAEWWQAAEPGRADPDDVAPRGLYGHYLRFVLDRITAALPAHVTLHCLTARADELCRDPQGGWRVVLAGGTWIRADRVVLTTGHAVNELDGTQSRFAAHAADRPGTRYLRGDSAADMPLDDIPAGDNVGIIGLGLSFYDVMASLTTGRGGRFVPDGADGLRYVPSGREPRMFAGSRSGVPFPARARNQKPSDHAYRPALFTVERIRQLRGSGPLDFRRDVLPWLLGEMQLVSACAAARRAYDERTAGLLAEEAADCAATSACPPQEAVLRTARRFGLDEVPAVDLQAWARPFAEHRFAGPEEFTAALRRWMLDDIAAAELGNADGPFKATTDTLRDVRAVNKAAVDFGGLTPRSHREDFLGWFVPVYSMLSAGPPVRRLRQALALMDCGLLHFVGPHSTFTVPADGDGFRIASPGVAGSGRQVAALVDARIPGPDVRRDTSPLVRRLLHDGVLTSFRHGDGSGAFDTGGVAVTPAPYHPVGAGGPDTSLYVLGIPAEHTRWLTHVGGGRPGAWGEFTRDADAIAADALAPALSALHAPNPTR